MKTNGVVGGLAVACYVLTTGLVAANEPPARFRGPVTGVTRISDAGAQEGAPPLESAPHSAPTNAPGVVKYDPAGVVKYDGPETIHEAPYQVGPVLGYPSGSSCSASGYCGDGCACGSDCNCGDGGCCLFGGKGCGLFGSNDCACSQYGDCQCGGNCDGGYGSSSGCGGFFANLCCYASDREGLYAGGSAVWLTPDFDRHIAFSVVDQSDPQVAITTTPRDFDYNYETGFRYWGGWNLQCGRSFRVTYFELSDNAVEKARAQQDFIFFQGPRTPTNLRGLGTAGGVQGDRITAKASYEIYTIDAEITQELNFDRWQTTIGGGYRHGAVAQQYRAEATTNGQPQSSEIGHRFDGDGPTIFQEFRIPLFGKRDRRSCRSAGFSLFSLARGSLLFGNRKFGVDDRSPQQQQRALAHIREDDTIAIGELQLGLQFDWRPATGTLIYVRGGWEAQYWSDTGNSSSLRGDMGLSGWNLTAGMDW